MSNRQMYIAAKYNRVVVLCPPNRQFFVYLDVIDIVGEAMSSVSIVADDSLSEVRPLHVSQERQCGRADQRGYDIDL
jgi:hypothetical protein